MEIDIIDTATGWEWLDTTFLDIVKFVFIKRTYVNPLAI